MCQLVDACIQRALDHRQAQGMGGDRLPSRVRGGDDGARHVGFRHRSAAGLERELDHVDLAGQSLDQTRRLPRIVHERGEPAPTPALRRIAAGGSEQRAGHLDPRRSEPAPADRVSRRGAEVVDRHHAAGEHLLRIAEGEVDVVIDDTGADPSGIDDDGVIRHVDVVA